MGPALQPLVQVGSIHNPGLPDFVAIQPFGVLVAIGVIWGARVTDGEANRLAFAPT